MMDTVLQIVGMALFISLYVGLAAVIFHWIQKRFENINCFDIDKFILFFRMFFKSKDKK